MANPTPDAKVTCPWDKKGTAWKSGRHGGVDYRAAVGTPITAVKAGDVFYAGRGGGWGPSYGIHVIQQIEPDVRIIYAHLSSLDAASMNKAKLAEGQLLGLSGATGNCHGPHLHLEARKAPYRYDVDAIDPTPYVTGVAAKVEAPKTEAPKTPAQAETIHTVTKGQTLSGIAKKYGTTVEALAAKNGIADPSKIKIGQKIKI